jgi:hypothetical protein
MSAADGEDEDATLVYPHQQSLRYFAFICFLLCVVLNVPRLY